MESERLLGTVVRAEGVGRSVGPNLSGLRPKVGEEERCPFFQDSTVAPTELPKPIPYSLQ
jgi:hypothetical protein